MSNNKNNKKKNSFFGALFKNLFGSRKELGLLEEEAVQSPMRTIINTYRENKIAMFALGLFIVIFIVMIVGPIVFPLDLSFSETSQQNIAPGLDMMDIPEALVKEGIKDISVGPTFSVGVSNSGKPYIWGKTRVTSVIDLKDMPEGLENVEKVAAGFDHVIALLEDGSIVTWGSDRQRQSTVPMELEKVTNVKDVYAGYQNSIALTEDGHVYYFGNSMNNDYNAWHEYQGQIDKIALSSDAVLGLTKNGKAVYLGMEQNSYSNIPEDLGKVVDIAGTTTTMAAVDEDGNVKVWGNVGSRPEGNIPELDSDKIISLTSGRNHYVGLTENKKAVSWGAENYKQSIVPKSLVEKNISKIYSGFFQNYAITEDGSLETWGLKGYILGSDDFGRDILRRLLNGGRMSMTVGAVAVVISTTIGVIIGGVSGYFGGRLDNILQRFSEMVSSLPFLPFAMILSSLIGNKLPSRQKTYMLMVILGLLSWTGLQRLVRAQILAIREEEYVVAAQSVGIKRGSIIFRHILPNVISVVIVSATLSFGTSMLTESSLSYLGFGVQPPQPTWGNMLRGANDSIVIQNYWWRWVFASIVLGICVICINLIGEGLRTAIDPRSQER